MRTKHEVDEGKLSIFILQMRNRDISQTDRRRPPEKPE